MRRAARLSKQRLRSDALLLKRADYGDSDLVVQLFTFETGALSAIARGARRSKKRFAVLEPMHVLRVACDLTPSRELATLTEAALARPRLGLTSHLASMQAAGRALRWLRRAAPPRTPEPALWTEINALLDALDAAEPEDAASLLGAAGLRMLVAAGWALELEQCVRCNKPAPERARAVVDVRAGGIVCRSCGGIGPLVSSRLRARLVAASRGDASALSDAADAELAIELVDQTFAAHGRGEAT
jgi:DNA repair protein RecO (recombination protein O)